MRCPLFFYGGAMVTVQLYNGSGAQKKRNSTKQPTGGITRQGTLKEPCNVLHPTISFNAPQGSGGQFSYQDYSMIRVFNRYYFIDGWEYHDGLWTCHASIDVLATYKSTIGGNSMYVLRHSSNLVFNPYIVDTMYPATCDAEVKTYGFPETGNFVSSINAGTFVLGVIGGDAEGFGAE